MRKGEAGLRVTFVRHQLGSIIATVVDFGSMTSLVQWFRADPVMATALGALGGGVTNFLLGRHWVFGAGAGDRQAQAFKYLLVSAGSLGANVLGEYLLHHLLGLQYLFARTLVAVAVAVLWNYPLQRRFVFRIREST